MVWFIISSMVLVSIFGLSWLVWDAVLSGSGGAVVAKKSKSPKSDYTEIAPGIPKPSTTLAHLLVAEMLRNLDVSATTRSDESRDGYVSYTVKTDFPSFSVIERKGCYSSYGHMSVSREYIVSGKHYPFDSAERDILYKGLKTFRKLREEREKVRKEGERQQEALDAIANAMGIKEEE